MVTTRELPQNVRPPLSITPVVQMDFTPFDTWQALVLACQERGNVAGTAVPAKGPTAFAVALAVKVLDLQFGLGTCVLRVDQEQSFVAVAAAIAAKRVPTLR